MKAKAGIVHQGWGRSPGAAGVARQAHLRGVGGWPTSGRSLRFCRLSRRSWGLESDWEGDGRDRGPSAHGPWHLLVPAGSTPSADPEDPQAERRLGPVLAGPVQPTPSPTRPPVLAPEPGMHPSLSRLLDASVTTVIQYAPGP